MSSMMADIRGAAVSHSRMMELRGATQYGATQYGATQHEDDDRKLDVSALLGVVLWVVQVVVLVRMINLIFRWM